MHLSSSKVLPVINTNHTATIAAELENDEIVVGQCEISHPVRSPPKASTSNPTSSNQAGGSWNWNVKNFDPPSDPISEHGNGTSQSGIAGTPTSQIFDPFSTHHLRVSGGFEALVSSSSSRPMPSPSLLAVGNSGDGLDPEQEDDQEQEDEDDDECFVEDQGASTSSGAKTNAGTEKSARGNVAFDKDKGESQEDQLGARIKSE